MTGIFAVGWVGFLGSGFSSFILFSGLVAFGDAWGGSFDFAFLSWGIGFEGPGFELTSSWGFFGRGSLLGVTFLDMETFSFTLATGVTGAVDLDFSVDSLDEDLDLFFLFGETAIDEPLESSSDRECTTGFVEELRGWFLRGKGSKEADCTVREVGWAFSSRLICSEAGARSWGDVEKA